MADVEENMEEVAVEQGQEEQQKLKILLSPTIKHKAQLLVALPWTRVCVRI